MARSFALALALGLSLCHLQGCGGAAEETTAAPDETDETTTVAPTTSTMVAGAAQTVQSSLRVGGTGISLAVAEAMKPMIEDGLATTMAGVSADDVTITGLVQNRRLSEDRRLDAHAGTIDADFVVVVPAGVAVTSVTDAVSAAKADPTATIAAIAAAAVKPEFAVALAAVNAALGGDAAAGLTLLGSLTVVVSDPEVVVTEPVVAADLEALAAACTADLCVINATADTCAQCGGLCAAGAGCSVPKIQAANAEACASYAMCSIMTTGEVPTSDVTVEMAAEDIATKCTTTLCPNAAASLLDGTETCLPCAQACAGAAACADAAVALANAVACASYASCTFDSARRLSFDLVI